MRNDRFYKANSVNNLFFVLCAFACFCFTSHAIAQSGRRKTLPPSPPVAVETTTATEDDQSPVPVSSIIVVGDLIDFAEYRHSDYVDQAVKACVKQFQERPVMNATANGSLKRKAAIERAKAETGAYVLLLEITLKDNGIDRDLRPREETICIINYYLLMPKTGKVFLEGKVDPSDKRVLMGGAVLRLPGSNRFPRLDDQLTDGGREVAERIRRKLQ